MKKGLLIAMLIATLSGCSGDVDEKVINEQESVVDQSESQEEKVELENRYADCTVETCSQEMLAERYYKVKTTKEDYFGESIDIAQALLDLYGINAHQDIHKLQESIISDEELIADDNQFFDVKDYIDDVAGCLGQCESKFISYEEASSLSFDEALALVRKNSGSYEVGSSPVNHDKVTDSTANNQNSLEQEAEEYFANVSGVNLNRFEGITPNYDDYEYVTSKYCFNKKGTLQSESKIGSTTHQIYSWDGDGGGVVTISFIDGVVSTKTQVGLK